MKAKSNNILIGFISTSILVIACFCNAFFTECTVTNFSSGDLSIVAQRSSTQQGSTVMVTDKQVGSIGNTVTTNSPPVEYVSDNTFTNSVCVAFKDAFIYLFEHISPDGK